MLNSKGPDQIMQVNIYKYTCINKKKNPFKRKGLPSFESVSFIFVRPFVERSYYVMPLDVGPSVHSSVRPSVCLSVNVGQL